MRQMLQLAASVFAVAAVATTLPMRAADTPTGGGQPNWKSSPFHGVTGGDGNIIPCRCLYKGTAYKLGEKVCMTTHLGTVITECDLIQNNTSWIPSNEPCTTSQSRAVRLAASKEFCRTAS